MVKKFMKYAGGKHEVKEGELDEIFTDAYEENLRYGAQVILNELRKYAENPLGFKRVCPSLYEPFQDYMDGRCSLHDAQQRSISIGGAKFYILVEENTYKVLELAFESQSSIKFAQALNNAYYGEETEAKKAQIELVRIFKSPLHNIPRIKELIAQDREFEEQVLKAYFEVSFDNEGLSRPFGKRKWKELIFFKTQEDFIRTHSDSEICDLAVEKGILPDDGEDRSESVKKMRQRLGIEKPRGRRSKDIPTVATTPPGNDQFPPELLADWQEYLLGGTL
jgi:hypothetical protein